METTLVLLKPDTVARGIIGQVISRIEIKWLKISWLKMIQLSEHIVNEHYSFLMEKPFFPNIKAYMTKAPVVAMAISWKDAIKTVRNIIGDTDPQLALPGSIRGDFGLTIDRNIIHASDWPETAEKELKRFFGSKDIFDYERVIDKVM